MKTKKNYTIDFIIATFVVLLGITGCSKDDSIVNPIVDPPLPKLEVGVAGDSLLQANLEHIRNQNDVPAVAAITIRGGEIVDIDAIGLRAKGYSEEVTTNDKWHIGSIVKSMTSTLAAVLVEQGVISWNTTITDVFPSLVDSMRSEYKTVRLDELLSHTSGLNDDNISEEFMLTFYFNPAPLAVQRRQVVEVVLTIAPGQPRGTYEYSNAGYIVAGAMLEAVTGKSWEELIQTNVFAPLGMNSTGFGPPGNPGQRNQPWGHTLDGNGWEALDPGDLFADYPAVMAPAGVVHCTLNDIAIYMAAHLAGAQGNGGLITKESFTKLYTTFPGTRYALGWTDLGGGVLWHNGSNERWFADLTIMPGKNAAFFTVTNVGTTELGYKVTTEISEILLKRFEAAFGGSN